MIKRLCRLLAMTSLGLAGPVLAEPWATPGDTRLRSDFALVANAGLIDNITTQWPIPWDGVLGRLQDEAAYANQPAYVREAAHRLVLQAQDATGTGIIRLGATLDGTNKGAVVRGFDALGRGRGSAQGIADWNTDHTYVHVQAGALVDDQEAAGHIDRNKPRVAPDGSYIAQRIGGTLLYAGYVPHWWGPGWASALTLSTNARPFPQVGLTRMSTSRFKSPLLRWIGPWRFDVGFGLLEDQRLARHSYWDGLRFTFAPVKGLEVGIARTQIWCGRGHPCGFFKAVIDPRNNDRNPSISSSQGEFDVRWTSRIGSRPFELYTQIMNEDSSPIRHSFTSHLVGGTIWLPVGRDTARVTAEYTSSISTFDIFSFNTIGYGVSYNDAKYPVDGTRYRGRALGFSLDDDSRLATLQASMVDHANRNWTLTYHRAWVSTPSTPAGANPLTPVPVTINIAEAKVAMPVSWGELTLVGRVQDDQLRPARGWAPGAEISTTVRFR